MPRMKKIKAVLMEYFNNKSVKAGELQDMTELLC